jgi:hypothetical protein
VGSHTAGLIRDDSQEEEQVDSSVGIGVIKVLQVMCFACCRQVPQHRLQQARAKEAIEPGPVLRPSRPGLQQGSCYALPKCAQQCRR